jgi:hypothetical protein
MLDRGIRIWQTGACSKFIQNSLPSGSPSFFYYTDGEKLQIFSLDIKAPQEGCTKQVLDGPQIHQKNYYR